MKTKKASLLLAVVLATGLSIMTGCGTGDSEESTHSSPESSNSSSEPSSQTPVILGTVSGLSVAHLSDDAWTITFDSVTSASGYQVKVELSEATVVSLTGIVSGGTVAAQSAEGTYTISVKAVSESSAFQDGAFGQTTFKVENWVEVNRSDVLFTGRVENDLPFGEFVLGFSDGSTYQGTLTDTFARLNGKHQYPNKMYYEGNFLNDQFEGQGKFSWSTTGNYQDANYYEGQFIAGNTIDCLGTFSWVARHNESVGGPMYWTGVQGPMGTGAKNGQQGEGAFRYLGNSVYTGGLYFDGSNYLRVGHGSNIWTAQENSGWINGGSADKLIYGFVGQFDSLNHGWIFGNGVWYFSNPDGTPYGYIGGNWDGGSRLGAWPEFNPTTDVIDAFKTAINLTPIV